MFQRQKKYQCASARKKSHPLTVGKPPMLIEEFRSLVTREKGDSYKNRHGITVILLNVSMCKCQKKIIETCNKNVDIKFSAHGAFLE